jgi:hypothetical protein
MHPHALLKKPALAHYAASIMHMLPGVLLTHAACGSACAAAVVASAVQTPRLIP